MKFSSVLRPVLVISLIVLSLSVVISASPQWVWNPDANTAPARDDSGKGIIFNGKFADKDEDKPPIKLADAQPRLFLPGILSAISNSLRPVSSSSSSSASAASSSGSSYPPPPTSQPGSGGGGGSNGNGGSNGGGGSSGGGSGGSGGSGGGSCRDGGKPPCQCNSGTCVGNSIASQAINEGINAGSEVAQNQGINGILGNFIQNVFGGSAGSAIKPASVGSGLFGGGGSSSSGRPTEGSCSCIDANECFLPNQALGDCDSRGRRVRCCATTRGSRTLFPDEEVKVSGSDNSVRTVTRSQIRRALLKNIVRGSGSLLDDTLDLILHPFLTKEDQLKVATRVLDP